MLKNKFIYLNWAKLIEDVEPATKKLWDICLESTKTKELDLADYIFLSSKLITIINYIDFNSKDNTHVLSLYFAIKDEDIDEFILKKFNISKFIILKETLKKVVCFKESKKNDKDKVLLVLYISVGDEIYNNILNNITIYDNNHDILNNFVLDFEKSIFNVYDLFKKFKNIITLNDFNLTWEFIEESDPKLKAEKVEALKKLKLKALPIDIPALW